MTRDIIRVENLTYEYSLTEKPALDDINLVIHEGEYLAIVGQSGAGKLPFAYPSTALFRT